ncbi:Glycine/D-amino acid oxidases (Deaminating) [Candidatus Zixiibacteriota bacterium]|nr:Glycine/D-amino acid oxidases (Deaminating) [candidate division Zixibacteria bacterium]
MGKNADVVVIGGGILGLSTAYELARIKFGKVIVVEKDLFLGAGSTSKCAGGIRAQFSTKINIQMSMKSEEILVHFEERTGSHALYDQVGYMFLISDEKDLDGFSKAMELQRSSGLKVDWVEPRDINKLAPEVRTDDIIRATFCKDDGLADPSDLINGYSSAARREGVEILVETEVTGFIMTGDTIKGITSNKGEISTPLVVNAAGPYAKLIGEMVKSNIPIEPERRQIVTTGALDFIPPTFPMVVDVKSGLYFHKESPGLLLGWADKTVKPGFDISVDPEYTDNILMRALDRVPRLETAEVSKSWAGLYESTPDHHAIIDYAEGVRGMFIVGGFSGHGLMHAPAAALVSAEILSGRKPSIDVSPLSMKRFAKGQISIETNVI